MIRGTPIPILNNIMKSQGGDEAQYTFSNSGTMFYIKGGVGTVEELFWINRHTLKEEHLAVPPREYSSIQLSPDDEQIALTVAEQGVNIWTYDISNNMRPNPLTSQGSNDLAIWTPDGKHLTFRSVQGKTGLATLFEMPADGSRKPELLLDNEYNAIPCSWSPDGKYLAFMVYEQTQWKIYIYSSDKGQAYPLFKTRSKQYYPSFSPDGKWIAYESDETGQDQIHVRQFPKADEGMKQVSIDGGTYPIWAENNELFYKNENKIMAVEFETNPTFKPGSPKVVYEGKFSSELGYMYDVTSDGNRLLILKPYEQEETTPQLNIITNWFEELKQKVPVP